MSEYQHQTLINQVTEGRSDPKPEKSSLTVTNKMKAVFIIAILLSLLAANFIFLSGFALGFSITILVTEILIFAILPVPVSRRTLVFCIFLALSVVALGATYTIFSDYILGAINFLAIIFLLLFQLLLYSQSLSFDWDSPEFIFELFLSPVTRPFVALPSLFRVGKAFVPMKPENIDTASSSSLSSSSPSRKSIGLKILLGVLLALPVMIIAIFLLSSADLVFRSIFVNIADFLSSISVNEIFTTIIIAAFIFPFLFSMMFSYYTKWKNKTLSPEYLFTAGRGLSIDSIIAATFLFCVNILYAIFAYVQFTSLFFSFQLILPENVTFAEYARQGFFQLSAITFINLLIIIVSLILTKRKGFAGLFVRVLSVTLIFFTFVQLASAAYRMKMYIDAYSLSKLRFFVSIFMGLIAILLIFALFKEFFTKFKFLKAGVIVSIVILLFTNYISTDALIAQYNTSRYFDKNIKLDTEYLLDGLSNEAIVHVIPLMDDDDSLLAESVKHDILSIYAYSLSDYDNGDWRRYSFSKENAKKAIEKYFGSTLEKELEPFR